MTDAARDPPRDELRVRRGGADRAERRPGSRCCASPLHRRLRHRQPRVSPRRRGRGDGMCDRAPGRRRAAARRAGTALRMHVDDYVALLAAEAPVEQHGHGRELLLPVRLRVPTTTCTPSGPMPAPPSSPASASRPIGSCPRRSWPSGSRRSAGSGRRGAWRCTTARSRRWWRPCASVRRVPRRASTRFPRCADAGSPPPRPRAGRCRRHSVRGRASTAPSATNRSSQRVAERLGLRYIGASFSLT